MNKLAYITLEDLAANRSDAMVDGPFGSNLKASEYVEAGVPIVRLQNIRRGYFRSKDIKFVTPTKARELSRHSYEPGDVVIAKLGECGASCIVPESAGRGVIVADVVRFRGDRARIDHRYLVHFLNSPFALRQIGALSKGSTRARVNLSDFKGIVVPLPLLAEQRRIADILDKADAIRRKRQEAIGLTENLLRSTFLEMFGDPVTNPKGWRLTPLRETFAVDPRIGTLVPASDNPGILVVRVGELGGYDVSLNRSKRVQLSTVERERFLAEAGDVLLARAIGSEEHLGKASVLQATEEPVAFDSHVMRVRFKPSAVDPYFFLQWLRSTGGRARFMREAGRTAVQFNVNGTQLARVEIPLPPIDKQRRFRAVLDRVRFIERRGRSGMSDAEKLFASLVQRSFRDGDLREAPRC